MLVISRRVGESVYIGDDVRVEVTRVNGGQVGLAIDAPKHVRILREEICRADNNARQHPVDDTR